MSDPRRSIFGLRPRSSVGSWVVLACLGSAALGQERPLGVLDIRIPLGPPQALVVVFNQPVAPDTWSPGQVPMGLHIVPSVAGRYDWPDSVTLRFIPAKPFAPAVYYAVTLDSTFAGRDGARLERNATYRLQPEVLRTDVVLRRQGNSLSDPLDLVFSRSAGMAGNTSDRPPRGVTLTPATDGRWLWLDSLRLRFTPARPFVAGVQYAIVVDSTFLGPSGIGLHAHAVLRFPDPVWIMWHRLPGSPTDPLILKFSAPIALAASPESLLSIDPRVDGVITLPDSMTLQFTPRTRFKPGIDYVARLSDRLHAVNGARLVASRLWAAEFAFWLQLVERPLELVRPTEPLTFRFNHRVQPSSGAGRALPRWIRLDPRVPGHVEWPDSKTLRFIPASPLTPGRRYVFTLGQDFVTPDGFRLAHSITVTIRTGMRLGSYSYSVRLVGPITIGVWPGAGRHISVKPDTRMPLRGFRIDPPVQGSLWWTRDGHVEFRPDSVLQPNTEYRLFFDTTFRAPDGLPLLEPETIQVSTGRRGLLAAWPVSAYASSFVSSRTRFRFVMSEPTDPEAWADSLHMAPQGYFRPGHPCRSLTTVRFRAQPPQPLRLGDSLFGDLRLPGGVKVFDSILLARATPSVITVVPDRDLPAGCVGILTVGVRVALAYQLAWPFQTAGEFRLLSARAIPREPVPPELGYGVGAELTFTTPVSESELQRHVRIAPSVAARFVGGRSPHGPPATVWELQAAFVPATSYRVSADSALRDAFGQRLAESFEYTFTTAPAKPAITYQSTHRTVSTRAVPSVEVTSINVSELRVCSARVPDSARTRLVSGGWWNGWWTWSGIDSVSSESTECRRLAVRGSPRDSVRSTIEVPWKPAWRSRPASLYAVRVSSPEAPRDSRTPSMVVFHVTDLAVHARLDRDRATVLVANRSDGAPVARAAVTATTCSGDVIATAATDRSGLAELAGMATAEQRARVGCDPSSWRILEVTTPYDYDALNVPMSGSRETLVGALPAAVVITDRLVYRRGDSIRARTVVRRPSRDSIRWVVVGSERDGLQRRPVLDTIIPLSRAGTAELVYAAGPRFSSGIYQTALLVRRLGRWRELADAIFWITEDPAPRVYLSLIPDRRWGARGDSVRFVVEAWNRNGTPARGVVEVTWAGSHLNPYAVVPVPQDFTTAEVSAPRGGDSPDATGGRRTLTLNGAGKGRFTLRLPERAPSWPWRMTVRATLRGTEGPTQEGHTSVDVYPAGFNLAISTRPDGRSAILGARDSVDVVALRPDGTPVPGVWIEGLLAGRKWSADPQEGDSLPGPGGAMVPDTLDRCSVTTTDRPARCVLRRFPQGYASVFFTAKDSQGRGVEIERLASYSLAPEWSSAFRSDEPALAVDRPSFQVGDTAVVRIENGGLGGNAWLTVASGDRIESHVLRLSGSVDTIRLPIRTRHVPRVTVTATVWYPERSGQIVNRVATTSQIDLEVRDPAETMKVTMQLPDRAEAASTRAIAITTDTGQGALDPAEILVWAIDERLAAVDSQRMPDVARALLRPPPAGRLTVSSLRDPAPVAFVPIDPGSSIPEGTWDEDPGVLRYGPWGERGARQLDDSPGPLFLGAARARRDGTATLNVRLPEAAGRYRVIAVALTRARLGRAEGIITVGPRQ